MQSLFHQCDIERVFLNGLGTDIHLPVNHCAVGGAMLFEGFDVNLVGCDFNPEVRNCLRKSVGCPDLFLNPETDDPLQEQDQESGNGKQKFDLMQLSSVNHEFRFIG